MILQNLDRLGARADLLRDLGRALDRLGVTPELAASVEGALSAVPEAQRRPLASYHLRCAASPAADALRLLRHGDVLDASAARAALGELVDALIEAGLLTREEDRVRASFTLGIAADLRLLGGDLDEPSRALTGLARPAPKDARVLDLGPGSGAAAIALAREGARVLALGGDAGALAEARANAALNAVSAIDWREGSGLADAGEERFDRILARVVSAAPADDRALAILAEARARLAPGGRALVFLSWPEASEVNLADALRNALGRGAHLLVLQAPMEGLDAAAAAHAAALHPDLGAAFAAAAQARREELARLGARGVVRAVAVIQVEEGAREWTSTVHTEPFSRAVWSGARLEKILAARALAGDRARLLAAKARVPEGTVLSQEQVGPGAEVPSTISARLPPESLVPKVDMTPDLLFLATAVHEAETVLAGIERYAEMIEAPADAVRDQGAPAIEEALLTGLLELA